MSQISEMKKWLDAGYDYERPTRGEVREGTVLSLGRRGAIMDLGLKRDGFVPQEDIERFEEDIETGLVPGEELPVRIVRPITRDDFTLVSVYEALSEQDWEAARGMFEREEIWRGKVTDCNRGGVLVKFRHLDAFLPASHLWDRSKRYLSGSRRLEALRSYLGQELSVKFVEVEKEKNRLIASERLARQEEQKRAMERCLNDLMEGDVVRGTVRNLVDFGAFVDIGGADGLIHISELSWKHIEYPSQVLQVGDQIEVYVLDLDFEKRRIGLSLKRLQPSPWQRAEQTLAPDQLVSGIVTSIVDYGAFVALDGLGVDGLIHLSELARPAPSHPVEVVQKGDHLLVRVLIVDAFRQRIGLSLKSVDQWEYDQWRAQLKEDAMDGKSMISSDDPIFNLPMPPENGRGKSPDYRG
jgi:small subunit ribosomal protein S1